MAKPRTPYQDTDVAVERSQSQISALLKSHGVEAFRYATFPSYATIEFARRVKKDSALLGYKITIKPKLGNYSNHPVTAADRAEKQAWRVCYFWLKSKFEALDFGLAEFEREFMPYMLLDMGDHQEDVATVFFQSMGGRLEGNANDPFSGARPAPTSNQLNAGKEG